MCLLLGSSKFRESILRKCPQRGRLCVQDSPAALFTIVRKCWAPGTEGKLQFSHQRAVPKPLKVTLSDNMSESLWKNGKWAKKKSAKLSLYTDYKRDKRKNRCREEKAEEKLKKKQTVAVFQWLQSTGPPLKKRASAAIRAQAAQTYPCWTKTRDGPEPLWDLEKINFYLYLF